MVFREQPSPTHQRFLFVTVSLSPVSSRDEIRQYDAVHAKLCNGNEEEAALPRLSTARNCSFDSCSSAILTKKKGRKGSFVLSSVFFEPRIDRCISICRDSEAWCDIFFCRGKEGGSYCGYSWFFTVNNFTGGGASVSMSGNKKKRKKKTCKDSRGSNVTRKPRIAGGGGSPSWPKITFLPTPRNYHCVVPQ